MPASCARSSEEASRRWAMEGIFDGATHRTRSPTATMRLWKFGKLLKTKSYRAYPRFPPVGVSPGLVRRDQWPAWTGNPLNTDTTRSAFRSGWASRPRLPGQSLTYCRRYRSDAHKGKPERAAVRRTGGSNWCACNFSAHRGSPARSPNRKGKKIKRRAPYLSDLSARKIWSGRRGSNPRPRPWQGRAWLPCKSRKTP